MACKVPPRSSKCMDLGSLAFPLSSVFGCDSMAGGGYASAPKRAPVERVTVQQRRGTACGDPWDGCEGKLSRLHPFSWYMCNDQWCIAMDHPWRSVSCATISHVDDGVPGGGGGDMPGKMMRGHFVRNISPHF